MRRCEGIRAWGNNTVGPFILPRDHFHLCTTTEATLTCEDAMKRGSRCLRFHFNKGTSNKETRITSLRLFIPPYDLRIFIKF